MSYPQKSKLFIDETPFLMSEICSKLTIKTPEIRHIVLVFPLLTLNK